MENVVSLLVALHEELERAHRFAQQYADRAAQCLAADPIDFGGGYTYAERSRLEDHLARGIERILAAAEEDHVAVVAKDYHPPTNELPAQNRPRL
jgi:hypothetical protein